LLIFEWDEKKNKINISKHKVSFSEAATVYKDIFSLTYFDPDHSEDEFRFIQIGISERNKMLVISYTETNDTIRIISAREATKTERQIYEQN